MEKDLKDILNFLTNQSGLRGGALMFDFGETLCMAQWLRSASHLVNFYYSLELFKLQLEIEPQEVLYC